MTTENIIGEIIESTTSEFTAESKHLYSPPLFGSFIKIQKSNNTDSIPATNDIVVIEEPTDSDPFSVRGGSFNRQYEKTFDGIDNAIEISIKLPAGIYGVVYNACTTPVNKGGRLRAFWKNEEELKEEQPQLEEWHLLTEFKAVIIGYADDYGIFHQFIPPQPPKVHVSVQTCSDIEIRAITSKLHFLRTLMNFPDAPVEELIAACIREASRANNDSRFLVAAGKELASLMKYDYDRLQAIIRRIAL